MAETLAQKAARLGMKPGAVQSPVVGETLAQKAARLGVKPAGVNNYQVDSAVANVPVIKQLSSAGVGIGSALGRTAIGALQAPLQVAKGLGKLVRADTSGAEKMIGGLEKVKQNVYQKPFEKQLNTVSGKIGTAVGTVIPYIAPVGAINKATQGLSYIPRIAARTVPDIMTGAAQTGGNLKQTGAIGATSLAVNAVIPGAAGVFRSSVVPGYVGDVASGLTGQRGEDRTGGKAFIPGIGTAIGTGLGTVQKVQHGLVKKVLERKKICKN